MQNTGIFGIGVFLPDEVRRNDWWPQSVVDGWRQRMAQRTAHPAPADEGERLVWAARNELSDDPFGGSVERRVMAPSMNAIDMEIAAAKHALGNADVDPSEINLLLLQSTVPDQLTTNIACSIHAALGLPRNCFTLTVEGVCNGFQQQLVLADALIRSGQASRALLIQSSSLSRVLPYDQPHSTFFGDGATAVVVGPVSAGRGLLAAEHTTDGTMDRTLLTTVPGSTWYSGGRLVYHNDCMINSQRMLASVANIGRATIHAALARAGYGPLDVDFYAGHQANTWYRKVTQTFAGLERARHVDTFTRTASLIAANIPLIFSVALEEGLLHDGDLVVTQSGGSGATISSCVLRWGR